MKIKIGKKYITRDGKRIYRIESNDYYHYCPFSAIIVECTDIFKVGQVDTFEENGSFGIGRKHHFDLVKEIKD